MNKKYLDMIAIATEAGDNFHFLSDCRALEQGRRNSVKFGRDLSGEFNLTVEEATDDGLFGCRLCHRAVGVALPAEVDRKVIRAERKAQRARDLACRAAEAEAKALLLSQEATAAGQSAEAAIKAATDKRVKRPDVMAERVALANDAGNVASEAMQMATAAGDAAEAAGMKAAQMIAIARVYASSGSDKVRWAAAMGRLNLAV
jgi:Cu/Ag efflux protein CusF